MCTSGVQPAQVNETIENNMLIITNSTGCSRKDGKITGECTVVFASDTVAVSMDAILIRRDIRAFCTGSNTGKHRYNLPKLLY